MNYSLPHKHTPVKSILQGTFINIPDTFCIKDLPLKERPAERLYHLGAPSLSTREIIAHIVGGTHQLQIAQQLFATFKDLQGISRAAITELEQIPHLGRSSAARIKAAIELGRRIPQPRLVSLTPEPFLGCGREC